MPKITVYGGASFWDDQDTPGATEGSPEEPSEGVTEPEPTKPTVNDSKADWVEYAVSQGIIRDDAEAFTKQQLINQLKG
jgi:hypothetical protein